ncbi:MAG: MFS transporter [Candidatus Thermoplasmatota archaeon]|jgi:MFS family permease|nr:MFS transporter [Candidatus Thermoplasmatota archaeon]
MEYKYTVLTNTMLGALMAAINMNIVMITLPAIFKGLGIDPFQSGEFIYLLWILMGYSIVLASILVTFGRISDIFGRTRMYTLGFIIFTVGSVLLSIIPGGTKNTGATILIGFRMIQAVGAGFLMVNSTALLTDAFPGNERGKALGINQISFVVGSLLGLIIGGLLSSFDWHMVFIVNVPFAVAGTLWSIVKLKETAPRQKVGIDFLGNLSLALSLILISLGFTYTLMPYGNQQMGWGSPWVIASFILGTALIFAFIAIERRVKNPLFNLSLFKIKPFAYGNISLFLAAMGRGAIMFLVVIWLQGIYLPLHGFSYSQTPFWAGIYMLPMLLGMVVFGPVGGVLTDKYGARLYATLGMVISAVGLVLLTMVPYNFNVWFFEIILVVIGIGGGLFASPNTTAIMNAVASKDRASANGMRMTINNVASTISMAVFFSITITIFSLKVPGAMYSDAIKIGVPTSIATILAGIPPSGALFGAFLGVSPMSIIPQSLFALIPLGARAALESNSFFPNVIGPSFIIGLDYAIYIALAMSILGAIFSALMGERYVHEEHGISIEAKETLQGGGNVGGK